MRLSWGSDPSTMLPTEMLSAEAPSAVRPKLLHLLKMLEARMHQHFTSFGWQRPLRYIIVCTSQEGLYTLRACMAQAQTGHDPARGRSHAQVALFLPMEGSSSINISGFHPCVQTWVVRLPWLLHLVLRLRGP